MDRHGLAIVIEDNDLKQSTGTVGADIKVPVTLADHTDRAADRVLDVSIYAGYLALTRELG